MNWLLGVGMVAGYASLVEPRLLKHTRLDLAVPRLPSELDGFRCHVVADLHSIQFGAMERAVRRRLLADPADAVFVLGDVIWLNSNPVHALRVLRDVPSRHGVFGVLGNAEHKRGVDTSAVVCQMEASGVRVLTNSAVRLSHNGCALTLAGVDDAHSGHADCGLLAQAIRNAEGGRLEAPAFRVLLTHAPQFLADPQLPPVDVAFAGHTHGGQIRLPVLGGLLGHSKLEYALSAGLFTPDRLTRILRRSPMPHLYVSRGIGTGFVRLRLMCLPELLTVTFCHA